MSCKGIANTKILVLGPEIKNIQHRGIYSYQKSLFAALKYLGLTTGLLTEADNPGDPRDWLPPIIHSLVAPTAFEWYRGRTAWLKSQYKELAKEVANTISSFDPKWRFLLDIDNFLNAPAFFDAFEFAVKCRSVAPADLLARFITSTKRASGEIRGEAVDVDFTAAAGYNIIITSSPTPIRSRTGRVRIIQTVHDLIPYEFPFGSDDPATFLNSLSTALRYTDHILAMSNHTASMLAAALPQHAHKCSVIYQANPIDGLIDRVPKDPSMQINLLKLSGVERQNYFIYIGAIEKRKNIETILRAFLMLDRPSGLKLLLSGPVNEIYLQETGLADYFRSPQAKADGVLYAGFIPDEQKVLLLQNACALVFPSLLEGFGLPVLEAMSVGCPVITTQFGSLPEVGGDAVLYLKDPFDTCGLATLMKQLMSDRRLSADLHDKGMLRAQDFSVNAFAARLQNWGLRNGLFEAKIMIEDL